MAALLYYRSSDNGRQGLPAAVTSGATMHTSTRRLTRMLPAHIATLTTTARKHPMLVMQLASLHAIGSFCSLQAMVGITVSFLQTMKAMEPLLAVGFTYVVYRAKPSACHQSYFQVLMLFGISTGRCLPEWSIFVAAPRRLRPSALCQLVLFKCSDVPIGTDVDMLRVHAY
eukprot:1195877-Prorocentrum_minimum.AAC.8